MSELFGRVNLKLLHTFVLVAEHKSFKFAAEETLRSQSAVSTRIKQLEGQLRVPLFHRTTRHVKLTKEGELLLVGAKRAMHTIEDCLHTIHEANDIRKGRIALACSPTIGATKLSKILAAFERECPEVEITVHELDADALHDSVRLEEVDLAIGAVVADPDLECERLFDDELVALVPTVHDDDPACDSVTPEQLAGMPLLLLNSSVAVHTLLDAEFGERGLPLSTSHQFSQAQTLAAMVEAGRGIAVLTRSAIPPAANPGYKAKRIAGPNLACQVGLIKLKGRVHPPVVDKLVRLVRDLIRVEAPARVRTEPRAALIAAPDTDFPQPACARQHTGVGGESGNGGLLGRKMRAVSSHL